MSQVLETEENWFGFEVAPFHVTPDTSLLFSHRRFEEAVSALHYGVTQGKGFIVITGEVGAGKTTLLRHFLSLHHESIRAAVILNTGLGADELLEAIAEDLGIALGKIENGEKRRRKVLVDAINEFLLKEFEAGRTVAVFIDEAQNLPIEALEALRMLSNLETERDKLIQIVLLGQPELQPMLSRPDLVQLRSRVAVTYHLMPMDQDETAAYIAYRIAAARPERPVLFSSRAVHAIHAYAGGIPRIVNIVCDQSLLAGAAQKTDVIEAELVESVIAGFEHIDRPVDSSRGFPTAFQLAIITVLTAGAAYGIIRGADHFRAAPKAAPPPSTTPQAPVVVSPVKRLVASLGIEPPEGAEFMTLDALASTSGLKAFHVELGPEAAERLRLPALLLPGNGLLSNPEPALVVDLLEGRWTIETVSSGRVNITLRDGKIPLCYLIPDRPWMRRFVGPGARGDDVIAIQNLLQASGRLTATPNGHYGAATKAAISRLQDEYGVRGEAGVGPATMLALYALERSGLRPPG